jgi:hypothetical protein
MGSIKAQKMAMEVSESIKSAKPSTFEKLAIKSGYSLSSAKRSTQITRTKSFKAALLAENAPLLAGIQEEINAIKNAMAAKDKNHEDYRVLVGSLDLLTKNYQLLSGGATERQVFVLPSEVLNKNAIESKKDDAEQSKDGLTKP